MASRTRSDEEARIHGGQSDRDVRLVKEPPVGNQQDADDQRESPVPAKAK